MSIADGLHYITLGNPISKAIIETTSTLLFRGNGSRTVSEAGATSVSTVATVTTNAIGAAMPPLWKLAGRNYHFIRVAGLSGASAVVLGAIGSHKLLSVQDKGESKAIFETANRFHFFHSLALMGMPMAKYPYVSGTFMLSGLILFTGVLYYRAFTGEKRFASFAPFGGACLIIAWLSLLL